jgi:hypothetical protein
MQQLLSRYGQVCNRSLWVTGKQVASFNLQQSLEYYSQETPSRQTQCSITSDQRASGSELRRLATCSFRLSFKVRHMHHPCAVLIKRSGLRLVLCPSFHT